MRNKPLSRVYRTLNHEIHYMMSFIGGCLEIVSFMYLYKALIGYMTSNMIFGIAALANGGMDFESVYHISIILIWMVLAALHQLLVNRYHSRLHSPWHGYAIAMSINCLLLLAFMLLGAAMSRYGLLGAKPTPLVMPLVTIGLIFMYIQNFVIKHGGTRQPTATSVVTTVYVLMISRLFSVFDRQRNRRERLCLYHEGLHYLMVIAHFFVGALVTALLSRHIGFYSLSLALLALLLFTLRIWVVHGRHRAALI
ncbi:DUF1275 family protein [Edwardsiella piscicida]|uniref:YoaK family protein n=1 Tax=Edwardsiella piscicida TaxID=1263550 RepID=UPI00370D20F8